MPNIADELHHFGWNACSGCYGSAKMKRNKFILPALNSDRVYILNVDDLRKPFIEKVGKE